MTFSLRDLFWYCAGVLSVLAVGLLLHALNGPAPAAATASVTAAAPEPLSIPAPATDMVPGNTTPLTPARPGSMPPAQSGVTPKAAGSMDEVLRRLEARLASQGGSDADWQLLAQSYDFVGRSADAKLARAHQLPASASGATARESLGPPASGAASAAAAAALSGAVELSGTLKSKIPDGLTLFIIAKSVDAPGPPLAIVRTTTGRWPLPFTLDDSNAMVEGRNLSSAQHVTIEARVSRSGMAAPQAGDFQSSIVTVDPHDPKAVRILIDHVIG